MIIVLTTSPYYGVSVKLVILFYYQLIYYDHILLFYVRIICHCCASIRPRVIFKHIIFAR